MKSIAWRFLRGSRTTAYFWLQGGKVDIAYTRDGVRFEVTKTLSHVDGNNYLDTSRFEGGAHLNQSTGKWQWFPSK